MKIDTYNNARKYLETLIKPSIFEVITDDNIKKIDPLDRMRTLLSLLGNPEEKFISIQVSGTSGKGSTAYYISLMATKLGYKTGLSISPHLQRLNERVQINNIQIDDEALILLVNEIKYSIDKMKKMIVGEPSYFEALMAIGFLYFAREKVELAIIEVGLEGKYDASNLLTPIIGVLTNIDLDHVEYLGNTVEKIAKEASSMIKNKEIIVSGVRQESVIKIVSKIARKNNAVFNLLGKDFYFERKKDSYGKLVFSYFGKRKILNIYLSMFGDYQIENATLAIRTIEILGDFGFIISDEAIRDALSSAYFPGRFEIIENNLSITKSTIILDGAHNPAKMMAFITQLHFLYPNKKKIFIIAFKKNKDIDRMVQEIIDEADIIIATKFSISTTYMAFAMEAKDVAEIIRNKNSDINLLIKSSATLSLKKAIEISEVEDLIIVTGSLYLVGEVKNIIDEIIYQA
ncbi:bifunctional folylpolyglutamate synthase/dihydrofolate synthase [Candidatus Levyibacteriota bacterium]|nr:bifunctional folylpolyglutamate synthase/dihydrofolate synthase [Candidatus Levybacteria bacterium]